MQMPKKSSIGRPTSRSSTNPSRRRILSKAFVSRSHGRAGRQTKKGGLRRPVPRVERGEEIRSGRADLGLLRVFFASSLERLGPPDKLVEHLLGALTQVLE